MVEAAIREGLCAAVAGRRVVRVRRASDPGAEVRVGEPHLVFVSQSGKELVALLQTGGYSSRGGLPAWRNIEIADIVSVEQTPDQFELRPDFDRASTRYYRPIC